MMLTCCLTPEDYDESGGPDMTPEEMERYFGPREWTIPGDSVI